jgi:hypothetical protein
MVAPAAAFAGAWTLPQGTGQWLASLTAATSTEYFDNNGLASTPRYNKDEAQFLVEYGLTDRLTAIVDPGLQHIDIAAPTSADRSGLGYTEFGARYGFIESPDWVLSGQATLRVPGTTDTSNPAAIGYTDVEADFRALLGHNFKIAEMPAFFDLEVAQRERTDGLPSEFRADATFGVKVLPQWLLLAQSFNVISEGAANISYDGGSYEYYKLQLSAVYSLTPTWELQGGGYTTYAGRNALQENGLIFGVWHQF